MMFNLTSIVEDEAMELVVDENINLQIGKSASLYRFHSGERAASYNVLISNCHQGSNSSFAMPICPVTVYVRSKRLCTKVLYDTMVNCSYVNQADFCSLEVHSLEVNEWQYIVLSSDIEEISVQLKLEIYGMFSCY